LAALTRAGVRAVASVVACTRRSKATPPFGDAKIYYFNYLLLILCKSKNKNKNKRVHHHQRNQMSSNGAVAAAEFTTPSV
jgi:hypothetical protein